MKLFPHKNYQLQLNENFPDAIDNLKSKTMLTSRLTSQNTSKAFIGEVCENSFKVISSETGTGALVVYVGTFWGQTGKLQVRLSNAFKVLFSTLLILPLLLFIIAATSEGLQNNLGLLIPVLMMWFFICLVFMELSFRFISRIGLRKLENYVRRLQKHWAKNLISENSTIRF